MKSSEYTKISKSIGTQGEPIDLPSLEIAEKLYKDVMEDQSVDAFRKVFKYYRFAKTAESFAEQEVSELIHEAFTLGSKHFR